jgi:hypothetical protein
MKQELRRASQIYKQKGLSELLTGIKVYIKEQYFSNYQDERIDNKSRWTFIESYLGENDDHLIDIGCAEGVLTAQAAKSGIQSIGYEASLSRLKKAQKKYTDLPNLELVQKEITPENVSELPETDIILFLTVHHHWERFYGTKEAINMFGQLMKKCNKLFYEPPGTLKCMDDQEKIDVDESIEYYKNALKDNYPNVVIEDIILVERMEGNRRDPLFYLNTSECI